VDYPQERRDSNQTLKIKNGSLVIILLKKPIKKELDFLKQTEITVMEKKEANKPFGTPLGIYPGRVIWAGVYMSTGIILTINNTREILERAKELNWFQYLILL
jgi:hypothetical protein